MALADKLDTVVGLFRAGEKPTGSRDPLGIRRQAQGVLRILIDLPELTGLKARVEFGPLLAMACDGHPAFEDKAADRMEAFLRERLRYLLEERGFDVRNVRAVTHQPLDEIRPLDARRKLEVLPELTETPDFRTLADALQAGPEHRARAAGRRAGRLARRIPPPASFEKLLTEPAEVALLAELERRRSVIDRAVELGSGFRRAFTEAAKTGPAVDRFFTEVFVMADDPAVKHARLRLMRQVEQLILQLADVSEIVPEA